MNMIIWLLLDIRPAVTLMFLFAAGLLIPFKRRWIPFLLLVFPAGLNAQELRYGVYHDKEKVGEMIFVQKDSASTRVMRMTLDVKLKLILFSVKLHDRKSATYQQNVLTYAITERRLQDKQWGRRETKRINNSYQANNKPLNLHKNEIYFSSLKLFCNEPVGQSLIYSEINQEELQVIFVAPHHYRITQADGNINDYYYKEGICYKIVTTTRWATVTTILESVLPVPGSHSGFAVSKN